MMGGLLERSNRDALLIQSIVVDIFKYKNMDTQAF